MTRGDAVPVALSARLGGEVHHRRHDVLVPLQTRLLCLLFIYFQDLFRMTTGVPIYHLRRAESQRVHFDLEQRYSVKTKQTNIWEINQR